jgi:hypothetical protein
LVLGISLAVLATTGLGKLTDAAELVAEMEPGVFGHVQKII